MSADCSEERSPLSSGSKCKSSRKPAICRWQARRWTPTQLHGVTTQKIIHFFVTSVSTSDTTYNHYFFMSLQMVKIRPSSSSSYSSSSLYLHSLCNVIPCRLQSLSFRVSISHLFFPWNHKYNSTLCPSSSVSVSRSFFRIFL
jgi:hypothetical protein